MQKLEGANDQLEAFQTTLDQLEDSKVEGQLDKQIESYSFLIPLDQLKDSKVEGQIIRQKARQ